MTNLVTSIEGYFIIIMLFISEIIFKLDPKICSLINKSTIEKELLSTRLGLLALITISFLGICLYEFDIFYLIIGGDSWDNLLCFWLSIVAFIFFCSAYFYYNSLYKMLKTFNFTSVKYLPTLNIYNILPPSYFSSVAVLTFTLGNLIVVNDLIQLYLWFEIANIGIYCTVGVVQGSPKGAEAAIRYYFISFLSSLFCLWGTSYVYGYTGVTDYRLLIALLYNLSALNYNNEVGILMGIFFILISFFIKLGMFPSYLWVPTVYERTLNFTFLLLMTIIKLGFYFALLQFTLNIIIKTKFGFFIFCDLFSITSVGSALFGSFLLITRNTLKGFLAANSIVSWGVLTLSIATSFRVDTLWSYQVLVLHWNIQYILIYILIIFLIFNLWLNWYLYIYWSKIINFYFYKNNWLVQLFSKPCKSYSFWAENSYINVTKGIYQINSLTTLYYIFNKYNDVVSISFIWIVAGLPPFILFLTKFYIVCYAWYAGLTVSTCLVWFIINTVGLYGYIKGISFIIIRFNKEFYQL